MMGFLPNPWLILGMMLALAGVYGYAHHQGYKEKETEDAIVIATYDKGMWAAAHECGLNCFPKKI